MKPFDYAVPSTLAEASDLLKQDGAAALAGGTQLLLTFKWLPPPKLLVNLKRLPGLRGIEARGEEVWIGALTTLADVRRSPLLVERFPVLGHTARLMAVPAIASTGTVGGNIAWGSPQADLVQSLLLLGATVDLSSGRSVPLREFFTGPGQTILERGELIAGVRLRGSDTRALYLRHSTRRLADAQICSVALTDRRAVLGSCGPTPVAVDLPEGAPIDEAVEAVARAAAPRDDFRASAAYRMKLVRNLTRRGLEQLHAN
ncbi:MAG TPA: FAD binding domain-containing protein [Chloroflexota bacterium]|nr:FAD binding domain-containing protein [Chloroflexota bacterium]